MQFSLDFVNVNYDNSIIVIFICNKIYIINLTFKLNINKFIYNKYVIH